MHAGNGQRKVIWPLLLALAVPMHLAAQAGAEYAIHTSRSVVGVNGTTVGGCYLDWAFMNCVSYTHPIAMVATLAVIGVLFIRCFQS